MQKYALDKTDISDLQTGLTGRVIAPGDADYDEARSVFYGGIDRHPALIVRVANAADVSRVVLFARESGLNLAVRSGGHSVVGHTCAICRRWRLMLKQVPRGRKQASARLR